MSAGRITRLFQFYRRARAPGAPREATDAQLLKRYLRHQDEQAFEALVRRHGPMVLSVCRRILGNQHDAEDAFQAVFLVLVRKAGAIRPRRLVGNWLYGVAVRTALEARKTAARRRSKERQYGETRPATGGDAMADELLTLLDEELSRLPDRYRAVLVACDLEARTRKEAADHLDCAEGTVASRLDRARKMLAKRLTRRGLTLTGVALAAALAAQAAPAAVPTTLQSAAVTSATLAGKVGGMLSTKVIALAERVLRAMSVSRWKWTLSLLLVLALLGGGAAIPLFGRQTPAREQEAGDPGFTYVEPAKPSSWKPVDPDGDCTITAEGPAITLGVPGTPHDLSAEIGRVNAPRVLQELEGDFRLQVKVCGTLHARGLSTVPGRLAYQAGGLLLWRDGQDYVRLERAVMNRQGLLQSGVAFETRVNGLLGEAHWADLPDQDVYLRLERRGSRLLGAYSLDGREWTVLPSLTMALPAKVQAGIAAINACRKPLAVRFEDLQSDQ
jgi:RNA polymerase sigma factor (sigma-70 family)